MKKTIVISGATSGLGKATALELARLGHHLLLIGRNQTKGDELLKELKEINPNTKHWYYTANFSSISSTKEMTTTILKEHTNVDVILNNAGAVFSSFGLTEDGIEQTLATNHLGYFITTLGLLPILNKNMGRIVNVSSRRHYKNGIDFDSFTTEKNYFILDAYGQSKLANLLFTYALVDKLQHTGITINALHPGLVKTTIGGKAKSWLHKLGWWLGAKTSGISIEDGIKTHLFLTISEEAKTSNGKFYYNMELKNSSPDSYDKDLQNKLWQWSEKVTGVKWSDLSL